MHEPRAGRPALALDLIEPFRPVVAEAAVLAGLNRGQLFDEGFASGEGGRVLMSEANRKALIGLIEQRLDTQAVYDAKSGYEQSYRQVIGGEARRLAAALAHGRVFTAWRAS